MRRRKTYGKDKLRILENMRYVVIGGNGFIGKHIVKELARQRKKVVVVDLNGINNLPHKVKFVKCDISSNSSLRGVIRKNDKVLHLAAITRFEMANKYPFETIKINVTGTANVIQECICQKAERLVFTSSGSVYDANAPVPITEEVACNPISLYGLSKKMGEDLVFFHQRELPFILLRYGYVYGQGKTWGAIGAFIRNMQEGKSSIIYGDNQTGDFVHVSDIVQATLLALDSPYLNQVYNIGSGIPISIGEVYSICAKMLNSSIKPVVKPARIWDFGTFVYDISKAKLMLGFKPKVKLRENVSLKDIV